MNKVSVMEEIDALTDIYCTDCLVIRDLRKTRGKTGAHLFCIKQCTVGEQLQFLGKELMKVKDGME
ncbi:zinc-finger domain-containing protein [Lysinibacillus sp. LZ02]|uniref:zinc-finger domain-containing protein n=1 Tax=Lysinibacillus sp. LZ02 TaxID=3420668 RepID=UPI003D35DDA7